MAIVDLARRIEVVCMSVVVVLSQHVVL